MIEVVEIKHTKSRLNIFHVPMKQWRAWSVQGRQVFNDVYSSMRDNQAFYTHPKQTLASKSHWQTTCWNAAWTAASAIYLQ